MNPADPNAIEASISAARVGSVVAHVKNNNVSYLLGILISHMLGLTDKVVEYGSGMC